MQLFTAGSVSILSQQNQQQLLRMETAVATWEATLHHEEATQALVDDTLIHFLSIHIVVQDVEILI